MSVNKISIGISACVIGEPVRFDGGHKTSGFVTRELGEYCQFVPVCPEVGMGMPVPRPTIRLVSDNQQIRLVEVKNPTQDHTDAMLDYSQRQVEVLQQRSLCGYIVCAKSPTCGMERVKVYQKNHADKSGVGLFTQTLMQQMPWLPVEEDGRLNDPVLRENFITRVFCLNDLYQSVAGQLSAGALVEFHSRYKLMLMAHHPQSYRELGRLVAQVKTMPLTEFFARYRLGLMQALAHRASRKNNTNVLMHLQGYFKRDLNKQQKEELTSVIHTYRIGDVPLLVPLTLIEHYLNTYPNDYLRQQRYLHPYPQPLRLRYGL